MKKIEGSIEIEGIKRCYVEGAEIVVDCPKCGAKMTSDFSGDYLSYPEIGKQDTRYLCCEVCECNDEDIFEYTIPIVVKSATVVIEYDESKIIKE